MGVAKYVCEACGIEISQKSFSYVVDPELGGIEDLRNILHLCARHQKVFEKTRHRFIRDFPNLVRRLEEGYALHPGSVVARVLRTVNTQVAAAEAESPARSPVAEAREKRGTAPAPRVVHHPINRVSGD